LRLPHCLLKLIFPAERVVMGLRVCKLLSALAHDVDHLRRRSSVGTADSDDCSTCIVFQSVNQFQRIAICNTIRLDFQFSQSAIAAICLASKCGLHINSVSQLSIRRNSYLKFDDDLAEGCVRALAEAVQQCTGLEELFIDLPIRGGNEVIPDMLCGLSSLTRLTLEGDSAVLMGDCCALKSFKQLVQLNLDSVEQKKFLKLIENLGVCPALKSLDIGSNRSVIRDLSPLLRLEAWTQLTFLGLRGSKLLGRSARNTPSLGEVLSECIALTHLDLSRTCSDDDVKRLEMAFDFGCKTLRFLDLSSNVLAGYSFDHTAELFQTLSHCGPIQHLNLDATGLATNRSAEFVGCSRRAMP